MKVLGISGSTRKGQTTDQLVQEVLNGVDGETDFISLRGKKISHCIACLGCVKDNTCKLKDDMVALSKKIIEADALVIGAPNHFSGLNALTHSFLERFYQFRHQEGMAMVGKLVVAVGVGGGQPDLVIQDMKRFIDANQMELSGSVTAQGAAGCFSCGYGETCRVGAIHGYFGSGTKITEEIIPKLSKQPEAIRKARALGHKLSQQLSQLAQDK